MNSRTVRGAVLGTVLGTVLTAALIPTGVAATAGTTAPKCTDKTAPVYYAKTKNELYVQDATRIWDLPAVLAACTTLKGVSPYPLVDAGGGVWDLNANLIVRHGATLRIHGPSAGGPVTHLRLRSAASGLPAEVVHLTALGATLDVRGTRVTSWDPATQAVDTDARIPAAAGDGGRGRAFVRAVSYQDKDAGTLHPARLDILDSEFAYLGYSGAEAYGVSYKARGCAAGAAGQKVCDVLRVHGSQRSSRFLHNYMGTYTWGALGMVFDGNEYAHNTAYGLDPHDDSDELTITGNHSHHNGNHGIICSQRCNDLVITGNTVEDNGADDDGSQTHGIMLHRGVTRALVRDNTVTGHRTGAGIAVFDSFGNKIVDNRITGSKYGLRVSLGSHDNEYRKNVVRDSTQYAVFSYKGTDAPGYGTKTGRPAKELFVQNTFRDTRNNVVRLQDSDRFTFSANTVAGTGKAVKLERSTKIVWDGTELPGDAGFALSASTLRVDAPRRRFPVSLDDGSVLDVLDPARRLIEIRGGNAVAATVTRTASTLRLTGGADGAAVVRTVIPRPVEVNPGKAAMSARPNFRGGVPRIVVSGARKGVTNGYRISGLTPGTRYRVDVDGKRFAVVRVDRQGGIAWRMLERTGKRHVIVVTPVRA